LLIDECLPEKSYSLFNEIKHFTVKHSLWEGKSNGNLLNSCDKNKIRFILTCDKKMLRQQIENIRNYNVSIIIFMTKGNGTKMLEPLAINFVKHYESFKNKLEKGKIFLLYDKDIINVSEPEFDHAKRLSYIPIQIFKF